MQPMTQRLSELRLASRVSQILGLGLRIGDVGFKAYDLGFKAWSYGLSIEDLDSGFRV